MKTIQTKCKNVNPLILIGESLRNINNYISEDRTIIVTDSNIIKYYNNLLPSCRIIELKPGERTKNLKTINFIIKKFIEYNVDRSYFILGIGGGVVCDITGFAASIYKRGVHFGFVATTLLAQADASIGGKNGVNFSSYKNIIGTINQPDFIISDIDMLKTLPKNEITNGFAEIIKHSLIADEELFNMLEREYKNRYKHEFLEEVIYKSALIKTGIVEKDEYENDLRRILNFGHTFGHAIESGKKISHGRAISIGMAKALDISVFRNSICRNLSDRIKNLLKIYNLPTSVETDERQLIDAIIKDKKKYSDKIKFILLEGIGKPIIEEISIDELIIYI